MPATFLVLFSFDFITRVLGLSLLLAVLYGDYCEVLQDSFDNRAELRKLMLNTAFDMLCIDGTDHLTPEQLLNIMRKCDMNYEWPLDVKDGDFLEMMVRLVDNKSLSAHEVHHRDPNPEP